MRLKLTCSETQLRNCWTTVNDDKRWCKNLLLLQISCSTCMHSTLFYLLEKENFNQHHFKVVILIKIYIIFREEVNEKSDKAYRYDREVFFLHNS